MRELLYLNQCDIQLVGLGTAIKVILYGESQMMNKEINKFKPGNFVCHTPTKSNWIILSYTKCENYGITCYMVTGYCVNTGEKGFKRGYWRQGDIDTWRLTSKDVDLKDHIWILKNPV